LSKTKLNHRQLLHFYQLVQTIQAQKSMKAAASEACRLMSNILKIPRTVIFYHRPQKNTLTLIGEYDQDTTKKSFLGESHSLSRHPLDEKIIKQGESVLINDTGKLPSLPQKVLQKAGISAFFGLPLKSGKEIFGSICFDHTNPKKSFSKKDIKLAKIMTTEIADTLFRFHLMKKNKRLLNFSRRHLTWLLGQDILKKLDQNENFFKKIEKQKLTIVIGDFQGSTAFSLKAPLEKIIDTFSTLYDLSAKIAQETHGRLHETRGDEVLLTFPDPHDACLATQKLNKACRKAFQKDNLSISFAIHTGLVNVGFIGGKHYKNYQIIGSAVNIAAHIQKHTPPGRIYISKEVKDLLKDKFKSTPQKIQLKNHPKPTTVYSLK